MDKIILICTDELEGSSDIVCNWLVSLKKNFLRFSQLDEIQISRLVLSDEEIDYEFILKGKILRLSQVQSYWYRRSQLCFSKIPIESFWFEGKDVMPVMLESLKYEYNTLTNHFRHLLYKRLSKIFQAGLSSGKSWLSRS